MGSYLLTAAGADKPGLVAGLAKLLYGLGCNLEDSSMTRLQGEFAVLLVFTSPEKIGLGALARKLKVLKKKGLSVYLKPLTGKERRTPAMKSERCLVTVYGTDRPGLVYHVTDILARQRVNVTDLTTHRTEGEGTSGYILYLEAEKPAGISMTKLGKTLREKFRGAGITVSIKPLESSPL